MYPRQFRLPQPTDAAQSLKALLRGLQRPHHANVERVGTHRFHHRQIIDTRVMRQRNHRRITVTAAIGNKHRRQLATNLHAIEHHAFEHFIAWVAENHFEPEADCKLGTRLRHAGVPGQQ